MVSHKLPLLLCHGAVILTGAIDKNFHSAIEEAPRSRVRVFLPNVNSILKQISVKHHLRRFQYANLFVNKAFFPRK